MSVVLVSLIIITILYVIKLKYKLYLVGKKLPGPWTIPLIGNVQMIQKLKPQYLFLVINEQRQNYQKSFRFWLGPQLWVFLHSPKETQDALNDSSLRKADTFKLLDVLIGNGLLISDGNYWVSHRRIIGPAFHPSLLQTFTEPIGQHADILVEILLKQENSSVEITDYLFPCILDAICSTSMGKELNAQHDPEGIHPKAFHTISELLFKRMVNPLLGFDFIYERTSANVKLQRSLGIIHSLMEGIIEERAKYLSELHKQSKTLPGRRTFLDILLSSNIDGMPLSHRSIRDEVNTFTFAGVDTTTASMSFILYALAKHQFMQQTMFDEINSIQNNDATLTYDEVNRMEFLDMFIKECLRLYTIVPLTGRQTTRDTKIGDVTYCKGITLWINMYGLAHDEQFFPDPYEFRPERFTKENQQKLPSFCYIPFSGGPHVCIGKKYSILMMKILTIKIIRQCRIHLRDPSEELVLMCQMVLKSLHGIHLKFERR